MQKKRKETRTNIIIKTNYTNTTTITKTQITNTTTNTTANITKTQKQETYVCPGLARSLLMPARSS